MNVPDLVRLTYAQTSYANPAAVLVAFGAGIVTSVGPCVAPRYVALAALVSGAPGRARLQRSVGFMIGIVAGYVALGMLASSAVRIAQGAPWLYGVLAAALLVGGVVTLVVRTGHTCRAHRGMLDTSHGGAFMLGAASAFVASPCCTPLIAAVGSYAFVVHRPAFSAAVIAAFALGHVLPLASVIFGVRALAPVVRGLGGEFVSAVSGGLSIALALYYGLLA